MSYSCVSLAKTAFAFAVFVGLASPSVSLADTFSQTNLVSDVPGAATTDPNLKNPWGMSFSPTSPFWISNQGSGTSTLYNGAGAITPLVVTIPGSSTPPSGPTGQVFNGTTGFDVSGSPAHFIFDTLNGTIDGWNGGATAVQMVSTPGAVYTGLALASNGGSNYLYAADSTGQIRVFNSSFNPVSLGSFKDPDVTAGYVPFNIQLVGSDLYVTYAKLTAQGTAVPGSGGFVGVFTTGGVFLSQLTGGPLFAPWGVTQAPAGFGAYSNDLLVGNFGSGEILAYTPSGAYLGTLNGLNGQPIVNDFLWALDFRTGGAAGTNPDTLYFTAGINNQQDGLFGAISLAPEPSAGLLALVGLGALALLGKRARKLTARATQ